MRDQDPESRAPRRSVVCPERRALASAGATQIPDENSALGRTLRRGGGAPADNTHWLSVPMMLNIGRNIPATMVPTIPPRNTIISGSMAAVRLSTASSTSRS